MILNRNNFKNRLLPRLSCLLTSRLPRSARDQMFAGAAIDALGRLRRRFGQQELASMLGTTAPVVRGWEKRRRRPSGPVRMAILMLEGLLKDWPEEPLGHDDWRKKLWGYASTEVVAVQKREERSQRIDHHFAQFRASTPEQQAAIIQGSETWVQRLKEIASKNSVTRQVSIGTGVANRWTKTCQAFVRLNPQADIPHHAQDANARIEPDGSLTIFAPLLDGSELSMRVEPSEWEWTK